MLWAIVARLQETPTKKLKKRKPSKTSSSLVKARASKPSEELESVPKVPNEVQHSLIPSQGDAVPNSTKGESSHAPSEASPMVAPQDANVFISSFLEKMTDLMRILIV